MERLSEAKITEYIPTIYSTPCTLQYTQNGRQKTGDIFAERDSVIIIVYNAARDVLLFVKQFRAAVFIHDVVETERKGVIDVGKYGARNAITIELCAGLVDKQLPIEVIAQEEVLEECGYAVPLTALELVCTYPNIGDTTGARSTMFYCEVTDNMRVSDGGGVDDEIIEVVEMTVTETLEYIARDELTSPANLLFGIYWFLENKYKSKKNHCDTVKVQ